MPADTKPEDMPGPGHIASLRASLQEELNKEEVFDLAATILPGSQYVVTGTILEVNPGSFLGVFGIDKARARVALQLAERSTGKIVFSGVFKGSAGRAQDDPGSFGESTMIVGGAEAEEMSFEGVARQFAKALKKAVKGFE
jgi:curli biogenesis system outer membrane secretion channel CsgG